MTASHQVWKGKRNSPNVPSPLYHDGHLYFADDGVAHCLDGRTGEQVYSERLQKGAEELWPSPVLADGKLYFGSRIGRMFVLAAKPQFEQLAANDLGDDSVFNASPAVAGNRLYWRSDRFCTAWGRSEMNGNAAPSWAAAWSLRSCSASRPASTASASSR